MQNKGSFTAVSTGMLLAGQITVRGKECIKNADVVFSLISHPLSDIWLKQLNSNVVNLQHLYGEGKHRRESYEEMIELMMREVEKGKKVCGAFYGHAGVFAWVPHEMVKRVRELSCQASMEPGVSVEACLYADLGIDPGSFGVQSYEASQMLFFDHHPNTKSYLLLWQVAHAGDITAKTFVTIPEKVQLLVDYLLQWYPASHEVILYETAVLPIEFTRKDWVELGELAKQEINLYTTVVVPPAAELKLNKKILEKLGITEGEFFAR